MATLKQKTKKPKDILAVNTGKKVAFTVLLGLALSAAAVWGLNQYYQMILRERAQAIAVGVRFDDVIKLKDKSQTDEQVGLQDFNDSLARFKEVNPDTRFVYVMDRDSTGTVVFLGDSEPADSEDHSERFEIYQDATPELQKFFDTKQTFVEGPVSDDYGTWYSAIAPIKNEQGEFVAALGIDVPAAKYVATILILGSLPLLITLIVGVTIVFRDMSRRRYFQAYRFQAELMSIASQELRSPLKGIRWSQEMLLGDKPTESQRKLLTMMHESTLRLQESVEDMLQLAALGPTSKTAMRREPVNVAKVITDSMRIHESLADDSGITFVLDSSWQDTQPIIGDETRLRRVFNNLISNAIKYAAKETGIVFTYEQRGKYHHISIKNKGVGVPKAELDRIFSGFYRAKNVLENETSKVNTGMGLYMSRAIIEQHGGKLWIESVENEYATAIIELPIANETVAAGQSEKTPLQEDAQ